MKNTLYILFLLGFSSVLQAQVNEDQLQKDASALFEAGEFVAAHPLYAQLVSLNPRNDDYNFRFGASTVFAGSDYETAIKHLKFATHKTGIDPRAFYYLGLAEQLNYDFSSAINDFNNFKNLADAKTVAAFDVNRRIDQCKNGQGLLSKVKDIVVLEKTSANNDDFFRFFNLDAMGGRILAMPEELKSKVDIKKGGTSLIYYPGSTSVIYFASYGKDGNQGKDLYRAYLLPDGSFSKTELLKGQVNTPYDEDYPFMHPDGKTLYFCSKGHSSMGGYDVFRSIYDPASDSFSKPENLDFAINTPDDEFLFVTDSLSNLACFASGRSSALGELNVYKVRVEGIPVQVVFIQGNFLSEINPTDKKVKISVKDELTGRPIDNTSSSISNGEYVISLPKAGKYLFEVETPNSPIIHEGIVDVPVFGEPVVLKQELRIIKDGGAERLIINNKFDTPQTDRIAEFTASMMRKKAGLEVNATDELLAALDDSEKMTVEINVENAPMLAGFSDSYTVEKIVSEIRSESQQKASEIVELESKSEFAAAFAKSEFESANQLIQEASVLKAAYNGTKDADAIDKLRESQRKATEAERKLVNARNALAIADSTLDYSQRIGLESRSLAEKASSIEAEAQSGNSENLLSILKQEKSRRETVTKLNSTPGQNATLMAEQKSEESNEALASINRLRAEDSEINTSIRKAEREKESAKSKEKTALETRIAQLNQEKQDIQSRIESANLKAKQIESVSNDFTIQAELYEKIIVQENIETKASAVKLSSADKAELQASILNSESKVSEIKITDPETLALVGEETKLSRKELTTVFKLPSKSIDNPVDLKPVSKIQEEYTSSFDLISAEISRPEMAYKASLIQANAIQNAELREQYLMQAKSNGSISSFEADEEILQINNFINDINSENGVAYAPKIKSIDPQTEDQILKSLNADYQSFKPEGVLWKDNLKKLSFSQSSIQAAEEKIVNNNARILESKNEEQIKNWVKENEELNAFIMNQPNISALSVVDQEHKEMLQSMGSSNVPLSERIENQVSMTENYLELLDKYEAGLNTSKISSSEKEKLEYTTVIKQLNLYKEAAQLRLSGLKSDSEIASLDREINVKPIDSTEDVTVNNQTNTTKTTSNEASTETEDNTNLSESTEGISTSSNQSNEASASTNPAPTNQAKTLPKDKTQLILSLMPDYPLEGTAQASQIKSLGERAEVERSFISILTQSIQERERLLASAQNSNEKQAAEVELVQLRSLKRQSELKVMEWDSAKASESEEVIAANLGMNTSLSDEEIKLFELINSPTPSEDAKSAYESEIFSDLVSSNTDASQQINNLDQIATVHSDIKEKERELLMEESDSKKKKLDRKIEDLYTKVAFMEMGNGSKLKSIAETEYEKNQTLTDDLGAEKFDLVKSNSYFDDKVDEYLNDAERKMADASQIRENAVRIGDPIEKNYRLREAFSLESEAIENQRRAIKILENIESLNGKEKVYMASLDAQEKAAQNQESIAQNQEQEKVVAPESIASSQVQDTTETQGEKIVTKSETPANTNPVQPANQERDETAENIAVAQETSLPPSRNLDQNLERRMASVQNTDPLENSALSESELETKRRSEAYIRYQNLLKEAENRKAEIETTLNEREKLLQDTKLIETQIAKLEVSIAAETDMAIKEGLKEEQKRLRSQAQVNYSRLELLDQKIAADEVFLGGILDEATVVAEKLRENPVAIAPSAIANASPDLRAKSAEVRNYLFEYPNALTEDLFAVFESAPYSANSPIPMNPAMPKGVIFKVQVGAFKNDIPQDLFGGFAPISGESLNSGITRYTVGLFRQYTGANLAKGEIQTMGYPDAFVVAFIDGVRVPLYEALAKIGDDNLAAANPSGNSNSTQGSANSQNANSTSNSANNQNTSSSSNPTTQNNQASENLSQRSVGKDFDPSIEDINYYQNEEGAAKANLVEVLKGLFYTVQVGVYSKAVSAKDLNNISPLNSELTTGGRVRYTTGVFNNLTEASKRKTEIINSGINDAFVTAYFNGQRITLSKAANLYEELGPDVLNVTNALSDENAVNEWEFDLFIGRFSGEVPANVAKAMLFLEESRGIIKRNTDKGVEYYSGRVNSLKSAELIKSDFSRYDVNSTEIIGYENGLQKPLEEYTGE